ncbi:hypothetical protein CTAYLR_001354 [Chrysophaeum taylorii]|uniref:CHAT domain-containing protein n=1 Tax=Chrysophaeum taylorii TaxID=2483200 RepID=A0AAD7U594_9STRA|nr:hypothetical protein CTAYLR_001354 [Chrysophaeum taylorii]
MGKWSVMVWVARVAFGRTEVSTGSWSEVVSAAAETSSSITLTTESVIATSTLMLRTHTEISSSNRYEINGEGAVRLLCVEKGGYLSLESLTLRGGIGHLGGALRIDSSSTVDMTDCVVADNSGGNDDMNSGGGIAVRGGSTLTLRGCEITGNSAMKGNAGGIHVCESTLIGFGTRITDNVAAFNGGGVLLMLGTMSCTNCTISGNTASNYMALSTVGFGGGIYLMISNTLTLTNTYILDNSPEDLYVAGGSSSAVFGTLYDLEETLSLLDFASEEEAISQKLHERAPKIVRKKKSKKQGKARQKVVVVVPEKNPRGRKQKVRRKRPEVEEEDLPREEEDDDTRAAGATVDIQKNGEDEVCVVSFTGAKSENEIDRATSKVLEQRRDGFWLDLPQNTFVYRLPECIVRSTSTSHTATLRRLVGLNLSGCAAGAELLAPIGLALGDLVTLDVSGLGLRSLPATWGNLGKLRELRAGANRLHQWPAGDSDSAFARRAFFSLARFVPSPLADSLGSLDFSGNALVDVPARVLHLSNLETLDLAFNSIAVVDDAVFTSCPKLRKVDLSNNNALVELGPGLADFAARHEVVLRDNDQLRAPPFRLVGDALGVADFYRSLFLADKALEAQRHRAYLATRDAELMRRLGDFERAAAARDFVPVDAGALDAHRVASLVSRLRRQAAGKHSPPPPRGPRRAARARSDASLADAARDLADVEAILSKLGSGEDYVEVLACFCCPREVQVYAPRTGDRGRVVPASRAAQLELMREIAAIIDALPKSRRELVPAARWPDDVLRRLRDVKPRVFHFAGHCVKPTDGTSRLVFSDGKTTRDVAAMPTLDEFLQCLTACEGLEVCFLNACRSGSLARDIVRHLPHLRVVCWETNVADGPAAKFAELFYAYLADHPCCCIDKAFEDAAASWLHLFKLGDPADATTTSKKPHGKPNLVASARPYHGLRAAEAMHETNAARGAFLSCDDARTMRTPPASF